MPTTRPSSAESQRARRIAAAAALTASGAVATAISLRWSDVPTSIAMAGFFGVAALAASRPSIVGQIVARGLAIIPVVPLAYELLHGRFDPTLTAIGGGAAAALVLTRPLLHTAEAHAEFAPVRFRRLFLGAATLAFTAGSLFSFASFEAASRGHVSGALGTALLGSVLLGSSLGIARMRGWGALLALASAVLAVGSMAFGIPLAVALLAAAPGALVAGALATAKLAPEMAPLPTRIGLDEPHEPRELAPARVRVADAKEAEEAGEAEPEAIEAPAGRAQTR